jgi:hypothetical protein
MISIIKHRARWDFWRRKSNLILIRIQMQNLPVDPTLPAIAYLTTRSTINCQTHNPLKSHENKSSHLEKVGNWARSGDEVIGDKSSNSNHSETSILNFLRPHLLLSLSICWPKLEVIHSWLGTSQERLSIKLLIVFP